MIRSIRVPALALILTALAAQAQDLSAVGGGGFAVGEENSRSAVLVAGASAGFPFESRHRLQFDYLFANVHGRLENRHFTTGSYVVQGTTGRARAFFQVGAGLVHRHSEGEFFDRQSGITIRISHRDTSLAVVLGTGATIAVSGSFFIRPQLRLYGHVGPTLTVVPSVAAGWRF